MSIIDEHPETLYLLESLIDFTAREDETLLDLHVIDALDAARRSFATQQDGRTFQPRLTDPRTVNLFRALRATGELLLGGETPEIEVESGARPDPITIETLVLCFKQVEKSAKLWNNEGGRQGYLGYIRQFMPQ